MNKRTMTHQYTPDTVQDAPISKNKFLGRVLGVIVLITIPSIWAINSFLKEPDIKHLTDNNYQYFVENITDIETSKLQEALAGFEGSYNGASELTRAYIATSKIEMYYRELNIMCGIGYETSRARFLRTEIRRLMELESPYKILQVDYGYRCPEDLFYGFLNFENIHVAQSPKEHYYRNGFLATDVGTSKRQEKIYAPDLYNKEIKWSVSMVEYSPHTVGNALEFIVKDSSGLVGYKVLYGHIGSWNKQAEVKTGDEIGIVGGCEGSPPEQGISTGCHLHIEYYIWDNFKGDWTIFEYKLDQSNKHQVVLEKEKLRLISSAQAAEDDQPLAKCRDVAGSRYSTTLITDPWFYRNPEGKWVGAKGYTPDTPENRKKAYDQDFKINCQGDCAIGAAGTILVEGDVACDPRYPLGTQFTLKGRIFTCRDRGGAIKDYKRGGMAVDFWVPKEKYAEYAQYLSGIACIL